MFCQWIIENENQCINKKWELYDECDKQGQQNTDIGLIWRCILKKIVRTCDWKYFLYNVKWEDAWKNWIIENNDTVLYS